MSGIVNWDLAQPCSLDDMGQRPARTVYHAGKQGKEPFPRIKLGTKQARLPRCRHAGCKLPWKASSSDLFVLLLLHGVQVVHHDDLVLKGTSRLPTWLRPLERVIAPQMEVSYFEGPQTMPLAQPQSSSAALLAQKNLAEVLSDGACYMLKAHLT